MKTNIMRVVLAFAALGSPSLVMAGDDWTGFYVGAHVAATDTDISSGAGKISDTSGAYGLQLGYNQSLANNWVVGAELSYNTAEYSALGPLKDMDTARLKLKGGYEFGPTLVYGILGYANIDTGIESENGVTYGIGMGYKATDKIIVNAEILRDTFDIKSADAVVTSLILGVSYQF